MITTLIPTFQRSRLLRRAIMSASTQQSARVHVLDNASADDTTSVVDELQKTQANIIYTRRSVNIGAAANFADSVNHLTTPYFSLLSDDDYLLPGFYARALAALEAAPNAMFWVGCTLGCGEDGKIWDARVMRWPRDGLYSPPEGVIQMCHGLAPTWTGIVFRTEVLRQSGFIDPRTAGPSDLDFLLRLASRHDFLLERVPVAVFTFNPSSFSATEPLSSFWPGWRQMFANISSNSALAEGDRFQLLDALATDAQRMLFRRGLNAIAARRPGFAADAACVLRAEYGHYIAAGFLDLIRFFATALRGQVIATHVYRFLENRLIQQRGGRLQKQYEHLLRPVE